MYQKPLVVDLDGTLLKTDLLYETAFRELGLRPLSFFGALRALMSGKSSLKHFFAVGSDLQAADLPYDGAVIDKIHEARSQGRQVYLASAASEALVQRIAEHLQLFDGWFGSSQSENLSGKVKRDLLVQKFGLKGFDYIGNDAADLHIWKSADVALGVRVSPTLSGSIKKAGIALELVDSPNAKIRDWLRLIRVHQYSKNILVFVAVFTSHSFNVSSIFQAALAFVAFSLCASSVYVLNDLVDLSSDRAHPRKKSRPLASGVVPIRKAMLLAVTLGVAGMIVSASISFEFFGVIVAYLALTTGYSFYLKRKFLLDVVLLAALYTIRVAGGAVAINVAISEWLLGFSIFVFFSLALVKRYIELATLLDAGLPDPASRNYKIADLPLVLTMASAAGFNAITVLSLYIASDDIDVLYSRPMLLWLMCPLILYWFGRTVMLAHRRLMDDDPIVFAVRDRISILTAACVALIVFVAI